MSEDTGQQQPEDLKAPLSFKLMVVLAVLYLGWRLVQGIAWVVGRIAS